MVEEAIGLTQFDVESLAEMPMGLAYLRGCDMNKEITEWTHCSPRAWLRGLYGDLKSAEVELGAGSVSRVTKALNWKALADWRAIPELAKCRMGYIATLRMVAGTKHTDLDEAVGKTRSFQLTNSEYFPGRPSIYAAKEAYGGLREFADALGLDMDDWIQVGIGKVLSTHPAFKERAKLYFLPEVEKAILLAESRGNEFEEIQARVVIRDLQEKGEDITINGVTLSKGAECR